MERRKFEDSFQEAFKDAEVNPSENVWTNIELDLEKAEGDKMKRRIFFFKTLAAASLVFAMCVAGVGIYIFRDNGQHGNLAQRNNVTSPERDLLADEKTLDATQDSPQQPDALEGDDDQQATLKEANKSQLADDAPSSLEAVQDQRSAEEKLNAGSAKENLAKGNTIQNSTADAKQGNTRAKNPDPLLAKESGVNDAVSGNFTTKNILSNDVEEGDNGKKMNGITPFTPSSTLTSKTSQSLLTTSARQEQSSRKLPELYQPKSPALQLPVSNADPGMLLLARLAEEEQRYARDEKRSKNNSENLWTSVGFAAGGFNANNPSVSPTPSNGLYTMSNLSNKNTAAKQSNASGVAYSFGVSVGTKLSNRWILQGGVNYLTQSSDYTADNVIVVDNNFASPKAESINAFAPLLADASAQTHVAQTFPYNVNNNVRFVSVPLQAGYLVINKKFGFQLNAGVSTDLFLQNTITPDGGGLNKSTQGSGEDSPYRSLNFSGLMGTELSYKLGDRYRVALNPGLRYPFSSVYKSNTGVDATPLTFDVGLRFRYIFH